MSLCIFFLAYYVTSEKEGLRPPHASGSWRRRFFHRLLPMKRYWCNPGGRQRVVVVWMRLRFLLCTIDAVVDRIEP